MCGSWRQPGFTLIELLVAIAIISILAAILYPVFEQCVKKAEGTSCLNNVRSLAFATRLYADDNDDMLPPALVSSATPGHALCWDVLLNRYLNNQDIYCCPSDQNPTPGPMWTTSYPHSYGSNLTLTMVGGYWNAALARERIQHPAETVLYFEMAEPEAYGWRPEWGNAAQYLAARHLGGANVVFCAGNAKWMKPQDTLTGEGMWQP